ncbi:ATP-binding domain-containing protein, partial [Agrobacterium rhizogenes]|nr:ATP-binding domain-containing protein [Rhizobium rhizogenes]
HFRGTQQCLPIFNPDLWHDHTGCKSAGKFATEPNQIHRTNQAGLLTAGANLRQLVAPGPGPGLQIRYDFPNMAPFRIGSAIAAAQGTVAILYPPGGGVWARSLAQRLSQGLHSAQYNIPPIILAHEARAADEVNAMMAAFGVIEDMGFQELLGRIASVENQPLWMPRVQASLRASANRLGKINWAADEVRMLMERTAANHRAYSGERPRGIPLLSIHQAKNRQFDHVIILWPPGVPGNEELKARLLYNGITRARRSCKVFVRTQALLCEAPFLFAQPAGAAIA